MRKFLESVWAARLALLMNLFGAFLVVLSFSASSSDFRLITAQDTDVHGNKAPGQIAYAICVNKFSILTTDSHTGFSMGSPACPDWENGLPAAVVIADHPILLQIGLILSVLGFLLQFLAIPTKPPEIPLLTRAEIKRILKDRGQY